MSCFFGEAAEVEHLEHVAYYEEQRPGLGARYLAAFEAAMMKVCENPASSTVSTFPLLQTQRLHLREIVPEDAAAIFAIHGDAERMKWFGVDPLPDHAAAGRLIATFAAGRQLPNPGTRWAIELRDRPGLVGTCGLFAWNRSWRKCAVGFELARSIEGKGCMREALTVVIAWGWREMNLNRIEALVHPENAASLGLLEHLRFVNEGRLRQVGYWAGGYHDMLQYSLLKQDWASPDAAIAGQSWFARASRRG